MFYINTYGMHGLSHIYMNQRLYIHSYHYCLSFYYQLKSDVTFNIHVGRFLVLLLLFITDLVDGFFIETIFHKQI